MVVLRPARFEILRTVTLKIQAVCTSFYFYERKIAHTKTNKQNNITNNYKIIILVGCGVASTMIKKTIQSFFIKIQSQQLCSQIGISTNMLTYKNGNEIMIQKITHVQNKCKRNNSTKRNRQCTCNVTFRRVRVTAVAVKKQ